MLNYRLVKGADDAKGEFMKKVLVLGANGKIAQLVIKRLLAETDTHVTLYLRNSQRVQLFKSARVSIIEGDVNDFLSLRQAMEGQTIVYANLGGLFEPMVQNIVQAMEEAHVSRLIYVTGLGLYHEVPGEFGRWVEQTIGSEVMDDTRRAANLIEASPLDFTIIRAAYMNDSPEISYELTQKGQPFKGTIISRASIADLIVKIIETPWRLKKASVGIATPQTDGNRLLKITDKLAEK